MFDVPLKLEIANSVLPRNLIINITTDEKLEKGININNECTGNIKVDLESTLDFDFQGNNNGSETETYVTVDVDIEVHK